MGNNMTNGRLPVAPLKLCAMPGFESFTEKVNLKILAKREKELKNMSSQIENAMLPGYHESSFLTSCVCPRFGTGEAKGVINDSVRGTDLFILTDVTNYSLTYTVCGQVNHMSPDDHYQNLKRIIATAISGAHRVNVVMPFLYESRQHKRSKRESLDCALALEELAGMGVSNIITFDAHDPRVQNSIPLHGFDNFMPTYQFIQAIFERDHDLKIDSSSMMVISPDEGAIDRAAYVANNLGVDMGMFYKRRDYSKVINGKNPIVAHEFLGADVSGKTVIIIDDMISSGESMLDTARELKERKAEKVIICCTFGLFTDGFDKFDEFYNRGYIDYVVTTNLIYRPAELLEKPWYIEADMTSFTARIIDTMNYDLTMSDLMAPTSRIQKLVTEYNESRKNKFAQFKLNLE